MRPTPYQTYLAERLQSARGLGWDFEKTDEKNRQGKPGAVRAKTPNLLGWFRFAR